MPSAGSPAADATHERLTRPAVGTVRPSAFGLHVEEDVAREGRFDQLTDAGRATASEALRQRTTGPQHRLLD